MLFPVFFIKSFFRAVLGSQQNRGQVQSSHTHTPRSHAPRPPRRQHPAGVGRRVPVAGAGPPPPRRCRRAHGRRRGRSWRGVFPGFGQTCGGECPRSVTHSRVTPHAPRCSAPHPLPGGRGSPHCPPSAAFARVSRSWGRTACRRSARLLPLVVRVSLRPSGHRRDGPQPVWLSPTGGRLGYFQVLAA